MFKRYPLCSRFIVWLLLPVMMVSWSIHHFLSASVAITSGEIAVAGLLDDITIKRDQQGVVYIKSTQDIDAFYAMGFVHAQDRLWQLELQKRTSAGRLSELFGKSSLSFDVWFRTLDLYRAADSAWDAMAEPAKESLTAYAAGVNAWLKTGQALPVEFEFFGIEPQPWTVYDSLAWMKMFALNLSGNYRQELERLMASRLFNQQQLSTFFPAYPEDAPTTVAVNQATQNRAPLDKLAMLQTLFNSLETDLQVGGQYVGSNAWVVSGKNTQSGHAIIANDPHLAIQIPSYWYVVDIDSGQHQRSGMSLVGLPVVVFGKNQHISWGGTNLMADAQDLYYQTIDKQNPSQYLYDGQWRSFESKIEHIEVKADFPAMFRQPLNPVQIEVRRSIHGPVISDFYRIDDQPLTLRWTALEPQDTSYEAFFRVNYASDWQQFNQALSYHVAPALNFLYADNHGNIGYKAAGKIPIRKVGEGQIPLDGATSQHDWQGYIGAAELPSSYNPQQGFIVSANNKIVNDDYPYFISHQWAPPARAQRIEQLLRNTLDNVQTVNVENMQQMQGDTVDVAFLKLLTVLLNYQPRNEIQRQAFEYLLQWDGDMTVDSQAATIVLVWTQHLRAQLFNDSVQGFWNKKSETSFIARLTQQTSLDTIYDILNNDTLNWCDNVNSKALEHCDDVLDQSLSGALAQLSQLQGGSSMASWQWGDVHQALYAHKPFSDVKVLNDIFERRIANGGSTNSINVATASFKKSLGYVQTFGAGFRQIISLDPQNPRLLYMNSTGQSGNVMSEHYDDMIKPFADVKYHTLTEHQANMRTLVLKSH